MAREQIEVPSKEQVLSSLGEAAARLREKLGESLRTVEKFDAPIEQATTSSLEALKAFSLGNEQQGRGRYLEAIPLYRRAVEIDPNFAEAWRALAMAHINVDHFDEAGPAAQKAYDLRGRVSELERLQIEATYYMVQGDRRRVIEILQTAVQAYPRSLISWNNLALNYKRAGMDEKAVSAYRQSIELTPDSAAGYSEIIDLLVGMNRLQEAQQYCGQAANRRVEPPTCRSVLLFSAVRAGDSAEVKRQLDRIAALPEAAARLADQKKFAAFQGRIREARELARQYGACLPCGLDVPFETATLAAEAIAGRCDLVESDLAHGRPTRNEVALSLAAFAAAACRDTKSTRTFTAELIKVSPNDAFKHDVFAQCVQALAKGSGDPLPAAVMAYDVTRKDTASPAGNATLYCRGEIYLAQKKGAEAAAQFQTIVDNPGWAPLSIFYVPAWIGVARAAAMSGDAERSRKAYDEVFKLWKTADADLPLLIQARRQSGATAPR